MVQLAGHGRLGRLVRAEGPLAGRRIGMRFEADHLAVTHGENVDEGRVEAAPGRPGLPCGMPQDDDLVAFRDEFPRFEFQGLRIRVQPGKEVRNPLLAVEGAGEGDVIRIRASPFRLVVAAFDHAADIAVQEQAVGFLHHLLVLLCVHDISPVTRPHVADESA